MRKAVKKILSLITIILTVSSIAGALLERPVLISYVTSGSMVPTIHENDLIFINPLAINYGVGDIIVFESDGKWICHRIFAITDKGFLTKGDNNIAIDQLEGQSAVKPDKIAGKVVTFMDKPVVIPGVGDKLGLISAYAWEHRFIMLVLLAIAGLFQIVGGEKATKKKTRRFLKIRFSQVFVAASFSVILLLTVVSALMIGGQDIQYGTTVAGNVRPEWVLPGSTFERPILLENRGVYPYLYVVKDDGGRASVKKWFLLGPGESKEVDVIIRAPKETSIYSEHIIIARYLPVAPLEFLATLALYNHFLPILVIDFEFAMFFVLLYILTGSNEVYKIRLPWRLRS
jgi:signal peptidase